MRLLKRTSGITLVALVVTIVILMILATVSINAVFSENGIIKQAQKAKDFYKNRVTSEEEAMNRLLEEYNNAMQESENEVNPPEPEEPPVYVDGTLPTAPKVADGMTKVKYDTATSSWKKVTSNEEAWYDYNTKQWANVVLPADEDAKTNLFTSDGTLDESKKYVQLVWIPRYAYQITSMYHQSGSYTEAGNIDVVFIDTVNKDKAGNTYSTTYPSATVGGAMRNYVVHPAFNYGGEQLSGFWVGKFETSHTGCTKSKSTGEKTFTGNEVMMIKPGITSWRKLTIDNMFTTCLAMNKANNPYGLISNDTVIDPHLMKNDEWGAVAYLSKSKYGKEEEVWINNNSNYITGIAGETVDESQSTSTTNSYKTAKGMKASTNGNITGIYDMSGGAGEYTAAYIQGASNSDSTTLTATGTANKYRNLYPTSYDDTNSTKTGEYYGDAVWETSNSESNTGSWYADFSNFPYVSGPFFERGGSYDSGMYAGMFYFSYADGSDNAYNGFRVVVPVL